MTKAAKLSATSYAILGLLAREPHSAYELNTVMQTSLIRVFWPRAASHVYSEPKKLLGLGLVTEEKAQRSGRGRTIYTITPAGRSALADWLREAGDASLRTQSEFMLKLILADSDTSASARATLERARENSGENLREAVAGIQQILENPDFATTGMPWNGIAINLMADILVARHRWSEFALQASRDIGEDSSEQEKIALGREAYESAVTKMRLALDMA